MHLGKMKNNTTLEGYELHQPLFELECVETANGAQFVSPGMDGEVLA